MNIANPYLHDKDPENLLHIRLRRWAAVASLSCAVLLVSVKFTAYLLTDSVSLLSSLMDSAFDGIASLATMLSVAHATTPADAEHRFGHGKSEALAAVMQAVFIAGSALFLLFESIQRFVRPAPVREPETGVYVMLLSIVLTGALVAFQNYVIGKTSSVAVSADNLHYRGDLFMNVGVIMALVLGIYSPWPYYDPLFAAVTAVILLAGARGIGQEAFDILMDRELPDADRERIIAIVNRHPAVQAAHDLRSRSTGARVFIEFHMEMDGSMPLKDAHDVTEDVERALFEAFPNAEVIIHQEPAGIDDARIDDRIAPAGGTQEGEST